MKRHSTCKFVLIVCYIVITKQLDEGCPKDVEESSMHTSYHVRVEVDYNSEFSEDEPGEAPQVFEDQG